MNITTTVKMSKKLWKLSPSKKSIITDGFNIIGIFSAKQVEKKVIDREMQPCSFDLELLERLIKIAKALEKDGKEDKDGFEIYMPKDNYAPLILHGIFSDQYYVLAPRLHQAAKIKESKKW